MKFFNKLTYLDSYILKQVLEIFVMGIVIFTSIIFAVRHVHYAHKTDYALRNSVQYCAYDCAFEPSAGYCYGNPDERAVFDGYDS